MKSKLKQIKVNNKLKQQNQEVRVQLVLKERLNNEQETP